MQKLDESESCRIALEHVTEAHIQYIRQYWFRQLEQHILEFFFQDFLWHQYTLTICNATILNGQHLNHEGKILHVSAYPHPKPSLLAKSITLCCIRQMETTTTKHSKLLKISIFWANVFIHSLFHIFARINVLVYIMVFQDVDAFSKKLQGGGRRRGHFQS